ncbi:MAG: recombinase family protein [Clostridia bacterium]|nr:recombinase family protein [Clostridia bacterium]
MKNYRAGIYLRLSSKNSDKNNSIEAQREITTKYAKTKGYEILEEYVDNGYSGMLDSRPALNKMILDISRGFINMVIVKDISRLTRNKNKTGWYTEVFFPDNDVRFISVTELIDSGERYEIDDSIMLRGIANQYYVADISKKVKSNKKVMKEAGKFVEKLTPYGYKKADDNKYKVIIDKNVANNIKKIYDMYIAGKTSGQIATYFNDRKIETPSKYRRQKNASEKWNVEQINDILRNPFYIGNRVMNKYESNYLKKTCKKITDPSNWVIKENTHEPIIEKEKYKKVQEIKLVRRGTENIKHEYLLRDLLYCGHCHKKLQYKIHKSADKKRFLYESSSFNCSLFYKKRCENNIFIKERELNEIVKKQVIRMLEVIEVDKLANEVKEYYKLNDEYTIKLKMYESEIEKLERKKKILYQNKCERYITISDFKTEYGKAKNEIENLENMIKEIKLKNQNILNEKYIKKLIVEFKSGNHLNNDFLKSIISRIEVYPKNKIIIIFNFFAI